MTCQVKLRGHRIELGEVESAALRCEGVRLAAAIVEKDERSGVQQLLLYVEGQIASVPALRASLREVLPAYALPNVIWPLGRLPLSPAGKLDRGALPRPAQHAQPSSTTTTATTISPAELAISPAELAISPAKLAISPAELVDLTARVERALRLPIALVDDGGGVLRCELPRRGARAGGLAAPAQLHLNHASEEALMAAWESVWAETYKGGLESAPAPADGGDAQQDCAWRGVGYVQASGPFVCSGSDLGAWVAAACGRIRTLAAGRTTSIVEIGCGTGMLALELSRDFEYAGVDPVPSIIERLALELPSATLAVSRADAVPAHLLNGRLVVLNSVSQYFPSARYLRDVLARCHRLGAVGVFVGDVRAAELLAYAFHSSNPAPSPFQAPCWAFSGTSGATCTATCTASRRRASSARRCASSAAVASRTCACCCTPTARARTSSATAAMSASRGAVTGVTRRMSRYCRRGSPRANGPARPMRSRPTTSRASCEVCPTPR